MKQIQIIDRSFLDLHINRSSGRTEIFMEFGPVGKTWLVKSWLFGGAA